jgi:curved DNA-binding protein CbpA
LPGDASAKDIKSAYRKLAKKYHPDQNPDDPKAQERFAEATQAYDMVGDENKRAAFDRGEIDGEGKPRFTGFEGFEGAAGGDPYRRFPPRQRGPVAFISNFAAPIRGEDPAAIRRHLRRNLRPRIRWQAKTGPRPGAGGIRVRTADQRARPEGAARRQSRGGCHRRQGQCGLSRWKAAGGEAPPPMSRTGRRSG